VRGPGRGAGATPAINPFLNPNATLSGPSLLQAAQALAHQQTQPSIDLLASQIAQNNQQAQGAQAQTAGYFQNLGQQAQQGLTAEQGIQNALNQQLASLASGNQTALQGIGQNAQATLAKYAPQDDAAHSLVQPGLSALTSELARQQGLSAQRDAAFQAAGANQGANYSGLAASNLGTFAQRGQEDLNQIAQHAMATNAPLVAKIGSLEAEYGPDLVTALGKLRQQEITNNIADQGLGIKQATLNNTIANDRATQAINAGKLGVSQQQANTAATRANNQAKNQNFQNNPNAVGSQAWQRVQASTGKQFTDNPNAVGSPAWYRVQQANAKAGGAAKPLSPNENNSWFKNLNQVEQLIKDGQSHGGTEAQIRASLSDGSNPSKKGYDPVMIQAAYELLGYGSVDQSTAAAMHNMGLRGGTYNNQPIKVTPNYSPTNPAQNPPGQFGSSPAGSVLNTVPGLG
jgi:hypothetical protein